MQGDEEVLQYCISSYIAVWKVSQCKKKKSLKKNRKDLFAVQLNKNSEGLVTVIVHAMKNVWWSVKGLRTNCAKAEQSLGLHGPFDLYVYNAFKKLEQQPGFGNKLHVVDQLGY